jgi:hypothetical protein
MGAKMMERSTFAANFGLKNVPQKVQNNALKLSSVCGVKIKRLVEFFKFNLKF